VVFDKAGNLLVADAWNKRVTILSPLLTEVEPEITKVTANSAMITWKTDLPTPTKIALIDKPCGQTVPPSIDFTKGREVTGTAGIR